MRSGWEVVPFEYWPPPPGKGFAAKHYSYYTTTAHYDISPIMCTGIFGFTVHLLNVTLTLTSASVTTQLDTTCVWMFECSKLTFSLWPERVRQHQESLRWVLGTFIFMFWIMVFPTVLGNFKWMLTLTNVKWVSPKSWGLASKRPPKCCGSGPGMTSVIGPTLRQITNKL